jgi:hypothetical protein
MSDPSPEKWCLECEDTRMAIFENVSQMLRYRALPHDPLLGEKAVMTSLAAYLTMTTVMQSTSPMGW